MPSRILKESICTSDNIDQLSAFQETMFYRMIVNCDDFGRMDARPKILASKLFPLKDIRVGQIEDGLRALTSAELVITYTVEGKPFLQMKTWGRHQQIRTQKSKYPGPESADLQPDNICNQLISDDSKCPRNPIQSESNPNPKGEAAGRFTPPTLDEVKAYCAERQNKVDAEQWMDFYASKGWKVGNQSMKDWKAAVRTWEKRDDRKPAKVVNAQRYTQRTYTEQEMTADENWIIKESMKESAS